MTALRALDDTNRYLLDAVHALGRGEPVPAPPPGSAWRERAAQHGVLSLLDAATERTVDPTDEPTRRARLAVKFSVVAQHETGLRELGSAGAALDAAGLAWTVFKGPVLSHDVYPDPQSRWFTDLDLLVAPSDFPAALRALEGAGARLLHTNWSAVLRQRVSELSLVMPYGTVVDLHWHVVGRPAQRDALRMDTAGLLARRRGVRLGDLTAPTFDPLDTVLHLAVHGALSGGYLLRWLVDLQQAVRRYDPAPADLAARARTQGSALVAELMLDRAARYVDQDLRRYRRTLAPRSAVAVLGRAWSAHYPPGRAQQDGGTARGGRALYQSLTASGPATLRVLAREVGWPDGHPRWQHSRRRAADVASGRPAPGDELKLPAERPGDREVYLDRVVRGTL